MDKFKLTSDEQYIEDHLEEYVPLKGKERLEIEEIIKAAAKKRAISLRLSNHDLTQLKNRANQEGIPYQTLISSILHKYITYQLVDKNEVLAISNMIRDVSPDYGK